MQSMFLLLLPLNIKKLQTSTSISVDNRDTDENHHDSDEQQQPFLQQGTRTKTLPKRYEGFQLDLPRSINNMLPTPDQASSAEHSLANYVSHDRFSDSHKAFLSFVSSHFEPRCSNQAAKYVKWREEMKKEIEALETNDTWTLEQLPPGKLLDLNGYTRLNINQIEKWNATKPN